jgi:deoxyadenosine/deoxycytidine kinase
MIVWISGPTGAGKSSMAGVFRALGYAIVEERLPIAKFKAFASDPIKNCGPLQEEIMISRYEGWQSLTTTRRVIFDRSLDEDVHVFCQMYRERDFLDDEQYDRLENLARNLQSLMPGAGRRSRRCSPRTMTE